MPLNSDGRLDLPLLPLLLLVLLHYKLLDDKPGTSLPYLLVCHHQVLLSRHLQHIHELSFEAESCEEAPGDLLDLDNLHDLLVHLEADVISLPPAPVDRLDQDGRAVSFEDALESVDVHL